MSALSKEQARIESDLKVVYEELKQVSIKEEQTSNFYIFPNAALKQEAQELRTKKESILESLGRLAQKRDTLVYIEQYRDGHSLSDEELPIILHEYFNPDREFYSPPSIDKVSGWFFVQKEVLKKQQTCMFRINGSGLLCFIINGKELDIDLDEIIGNDFALIHKLNTFGWRLFHYERTSSYEEVIMVKDN